MFSIPPSIPAAPMDSAHGYENGLVRSRPNETSERDRYLLATVVARLHTWSALKPAAVAGLLTFSSFPDTLTVRFEYAPAWFGNTNRSCFGAHAVQFFTDSLTVQ